MCLPPIPSLSLTCHYPHHLAFCAVPYLPDIWTTCGSVPPAGTCYLPPTTLYHWFATSHTPPYLHVLTTTALLPAMPGCRHYHAFVRSCVLLVLPVGFLQTATGVALQFCRILPCDLSAVPFTFWFSAWIMPATTTAALLPAIPVILLVRCSLYVVGFGFHSLPFCRL